MQATDIGLGLSPCFMFQVQEQKTNMAKTGSANLYRRALDKVRMLSMLGVDIGGGKAGVRVRGYLTINDDR